MGNCFSGPKKNASLRELKTKQSTVDVQIGDVEVPVRTRGTSIAVKLNSTTKANLENLQGFARSRNAIDKIAKEVLPHNYMNRYPSFSKSETLCQETSDLDQLLRRCKEVLPEFTEILTKVAKQAGLNPDDIATWKGRKVMLTKDQAYKRLTIAPLKSKKRCQEKIKDDYSDEADRLVDILRASIVVDTEEQLIAVAKALGGLNVVRLKNRKFGLLDVI